MSAAACIGDRARAVSRQSLIMQIEQESFSLLAPKVATDYFLSSLTKAMLYQTLEQKVWQN